MQRGKAILQHGTIRLSRHTELYTQVFAEPLPPPVQLPIHSEGDALISTVIEALTESACRYFGIEFVTQPLSELEWQEILTVPPLAV